jgi:ribosome biogenesis protein Nip4
MPSGQSARDGVGENARRTRTEAATAIFNMNVTPDLLGAPDFRGAIR